MKKLISAFIVSMFMAAGLAVASPADAQEVSRTVTITRDSKLAGQAVTTGEYSVKFVEGKDGSLFYSKEGEVVKASYKVTKLAQPAGNNAIAYDSAPDGSFVVRRIN